MTQTSKTPMPKQNSSFIFISIIDYIEKNYPESDLQSFIDEINEKTPYYVENLRTGEPELVSLGHLKDENYWLSHVFMNTFAETIKTHIFEPDLFFNAGDSVYSTHNFLKTAIGMPFLGPEKMFQLLQQENDKYNRTKDIELLKIEKGHAVFQAIFFEGVVPSPLAMEWGAGLLRSYIKLSGATNVEVSHRWVDYGPQKEGEKGRGRCEFEVSYKDPGIFSRLFRSLVFNIPIVKKEMDYANTIQAEHKERILIQDKIIEDKTAELKQANEKLVELDRIKTEFYTNITHELRTPLTLIQSQIDAVRQGYWGESVQNSSEIFDSVDRNVVVLTKLIDNLLDFSKIESGKMNFSPSQTQLPNVLNHIFLNFESAMRHGGLEFEFTDKSSNAWALVDKDLLEKCVYNLLSNALKFTPAGGYVKLSLDENEDCLLISVEDSGIGIAKENHSAVFDRFHQIDSASTRKYEGTGIGLSLAKKIVELHQGGIKVESELGMGCTFVISLPKIESKEVDSIQQLALTGETEGHPKDNKKVEHRKHVVSSPGDIQPFLILIVEDNDDLCGFIEKLLLINYEVVTAKNGVEAVSLLDKYNVDLMISDIMMPEMDGIELLKNIRAEKRLSWIPVIMLTARADFPMKMEGFSHGANDYIVKPFKPDELLARVNSQLSLVRLRREYKAALKGKNKKALTDDTIVAVEEVQKYIEENYRDDISREVLASIVEISPDHLSRMFKKHVGKTIREFTNELRIDSVLEMLTVGDKKIIDIAFDAGFESLSSFNRVFKKVKSMTPSEYKNSFRRR